MRKAETLSADNTVTLVCPDCGAQMSVQTDHHHNKKRRCWRCRAVMLTSEDAAAQSVAPASEPDESDLPLFEERRVPEAVPLVDKDRSVFEVSEQGEEALFDSTADESKEDGSFPLGQEFASSEPADDDSRPKREPIHEFQFDCPICHTLMPVSTLQIGESVKCVDCESSIRVPQSEPAALRPLGTFFQVDTEGNRKEDDEIRISDPVELPKVQLRDIDLLGEEDSLLSAPRSQAAATSTSETGNDLSERQSAHSDKKGASLSTTPAASPPGTSKPSLSEDATADADQKTTTRPGEHQPQAHRLEIRSVGEFLAFMADPEFFLRWITLTLILTAELLLVRSTISSFLSTDLATRIIGYPLIFPTIFFALVYVVMGFVFALCVLERTSTGQRIIDQWPEFEFFGWLSRSGFLLSSFWLASLPGLAVSLPFVGFAFWYWIAAPLLAISFFIFFPILLFSVIYNQRAWNPVSLAVLNSLKTCRASWRQFYAFSAPILLASLPLMLLPLLPNFFFTSLIVAAVFVFLSFAYFRLLGYLGRNLSKHLDILDRI